MRYSFSNKRIKVGDICVILFNKEQLNQQHILRCFSENKLKVTDLNKVGIKVTRTFVNKCIGYMIYQAKGSIAFKPYLHNNKKIYIAINPNNVVITEKFKKP